MEELQKVLPKLGMFDSKRIAKRAQSLNNDKLFKALIESFDQQNKDLGKFKELSTKGNTTDKDRKAKADELTRLALKQM